MKEEEASAKGESHSWAVAVGIDRYMKEITPLKCSVSDAKGFKEALIESLGFKDDRASSAGTAIK
jgi:uncharacterized caspase-like protein